MASKFVSSLFVAQSGPGGAAQNKISNCIKLSLSGLGNIKDQRHVIGTSLGVSFNIDIDISNLMNMHNIRQMYHNLRKF